MSKVNLSTIEQRVLLHKILALQYYYLTVHEDLINRIDLIPLL